MKSIKQEYGRKLGQAKSYSENKHNLLQLQDAEYKQQLKMENIPSAIKKTNRHFQKVL